MATVCYTANTPPLQISFNPLLTTFPSLASGVAVAAILRWGWPVSIGVFIGEFLAYLGSDQSWQFAMIVAVGDTLSTVVIARALRRFRFNPPLNRQRTVGLFVGATALGTLLSAAAKSIGLGMAGGWIFAPDSFVWLLFWMRDTVSILLLGAVIFSCTREGLAQLWRSRSEVIVWMLATTAVSWLAVLNKNAPATHLVPIAYLSLPLLMWAALRLGNLGATLAVLGFSWVAALVAASHLAATATPPTFSLISLWGYLGGAVALVLWIAAVSAERRQARDLLQANAIKLRGLFELCPLGIVLTSFNGKFIEFNDVFQNICGYSSDELKDLDYWTVTPRKYETQEASQIASLEQNGRYGPYEKEYLRKDGSLVPVRLNGMLIEDSSGKKYIWSIVENITEHQETAENLRIAATAFEAQVGIVVTDADRVILRVNRAFTEATGYTAAETLGKRPRMFQSGRHDAEFYAQMWECLNNTGVWQGEIWDRRKNGDIYPKWLTITAVKSAAGVITHYVSTQLDISELKAAEDAIKNLAFYDPLTGLPNRRLLLDRLTHAAESNERDEHLGALLFIDVDHFKVLNDTLGHDKGDLLLQQMAERIKECVREGDTVARLGGDEFVVLLEHLRPNLKEAAAQAEAVGRKAINALAETYRLGEHDYHSTASIGVTIFKSQRVTMAELLKQADLAMYQAKAAGRNAMRFFDPEMQAAISMRAAMEMDLRKAIAEDQFVLHYQPQVDSSATVTGCEALVRWQHPERGLLAPDEFISLAEETGLILPLGYQVLESACIQLVAWAGQVETADLSVAVNISAKQLHQSNFVEHVLETLQRTGADAAKLKLELTESMFLHDIDNVVEKMHQLKRSQVGFALDDFGTGYSSLTYLRRLPLDLLKIDRSFVTDILVDYNAAAIVKAIAALAQSLGLPTIAEGVELSEQQELLAQSGCHAYQGYLFSRPLPVEQFEQFLRDTATGAGSTH